MPVPTQITDLSTTAASNSPAGTDNPFPDLDNYLRAHAAFIAQLNAADATKVAKAGDTMTGPLTLNAAPTVDLHASTKKYVDDGLATKAASSHSHAWVDITSKGKTEGTDTQDPNSTDKHICATKHANMPDGGSNYWHLTTTFHTTTTPAAAERKSQIAVGFTGQVYARAYNSGMWTTWIRCDLGQVSSSKSGTGYVVLPGGMILQWGTVAMSTSTPTAVSFPLSFPSACISVQMTLKTISGGAWTAVADSVTASSFSAALTSSTTGSSGFYWLALGY